MSKSFNNGMIGQTESSRLIQNYEEQVYAGVLGKVVGVYLGRPFEGWSKQDIEQRWGCIDRYVHEDRQVPLVVADDDISGTLTFIRALEDSGLFAETPTPFFGQTWLNYLIEKQTILWWGGLGHSTEHTAYLRLKQGIPAPRSGSAELNGKVVAEQIGAQIFIDAFGLVAPGRPKLAARLARRAASVSHDGEALHAAALLAAMIAAAFVEKDMDRLFDIGLAQIPEESLIAAVHRDVRAWARQDGDWRQTYEHIKERYGYQRYGGNCHVIPNHALMVMAWAYAPDDFHLAQLIVNTAGWDTDCNAANVGSLMGVKVGAAAINAKYDFQSPFGDRILLPTADGTRAATDVLIEALHIARIGRNVMNWPTLPPAKDHAWHHFSMPGAQHGWLADDREFAARGNLSLNNVASPGNPGERCLEISFRTGPGRTARLTTPLAPFAEKHDQGAVYSLNGTPKIYPGQIAVATLRTDTLAATVQARLRLRLMDSENQQLGEWIDGPSATLSGKQLFSLQVQVPAQAAGQPAAALALELSSAEPTTGKVFLERVEVQKPFHIEWPKLPAATGGKGHRSFGWIADIDFRRNRFSEDTEDFHYLGKNQERGFFITGNRDWTDYVFAARIKIHLAERAGLVFRYQGLERYLAFEITRTSLRLVRRHYGETVLAETPCDCPFDLPANLKIECRGHEIKAWHDGEPVLQATDTTLTCGGAGFMVDCGIAGFRDISIINQNSLG